MRDTDVRIVGAHEVTYQRHPDPALCTADLISGAVHDAATRTGIDLADIDGLGVAAFTLGPDHAIDVARRCGLSVTWLMEDTNGGASGVNMLQHAVRALQAGDATTIALVSGDVMAGNAFRDLTAEYNAATRDFVTPLGVTGPNAVFAMLTVRHMRATGLQTSDYGRVAVAQRRWATLNPGAVYRAPMTLDDYLSAPMVADPLRRYDCVPPVTGADVLLLTSRPDDGASVRVRAIGASYNHDLGEGDGLRTGLAGIAPDLWGSAGVEPDDVDVICVYDDYPVMVLAQLEDACLLGGDDLPAAVRRLDEARRPVNTSGGQLSCGQAGAAAGMHGLVEAVTQLLGRAGDRQVDGARLGVVTGYGMVTYRYGACAGMSILERV